jgi:hypothetical protein
MMRCRWLPCCLLCLVVAIWPTPVRGAVRTFPAGSLVIPVDPCWQPTGELPVAGGCAAGGSEAAAAGAYGLAYRLQRAGVPVHLVDDRLAADLAGISLIISATDRAPVVVQPGGLPLDPPQRGTGAGHRPAHLVDYRGQPFVIDARDLDAAATAILADAPLTRRHQVPAPFSAPVARVLTGLPATVGVTDQGGLDHLDGLLTLAGLAGADGLRVVMADESQPPVAGAALSACSAATRLLSPFAGDCGLPALFADLAAVPAATVPREQVTTAPVADAGTLFVASHAFPGSTGHLRAIALNGNRQTRLWDAGEHIPPSGGGLPPADAPELAALAPPFTGARDERLLFTNLPADQGGSLLTFTASAAPVLQPLLGVTTAAEAAAIINAVRGRMATSAENPAGSHDRSQRLGAISRSSPALVGGSPVDSAAAARAQILYAGAEDGLLHAFLAGQPLPGGNAYDHSGEDCGRELWGYLPGSLLPALVRQPFDDPGALAAAHVDGSPLVADLFIDDNGDGLRQWRTVLVGTASDQSANRGAVFALDVSDPYRPRLLWETVLAGIDLGRSRGVAIGRFGRWDHAEARLFLTAGTAGRITAQGSPDPVGGSYGVMACALDLADGRLIWKFAAAYEGAARNLAEAPSLPALMFAAASAGVDGVVFGDQAGRLWVLDPASGAPLGGRPLWQSPLGVEEPIGGGIAVRNRLVLFATGGAEHADSTRNYSVYAVEILPVEARSLWSLPLEQGEQLWGAPAFDRFGRSYFGLGNAASGTGRLLMLAADGAVAGSRVLAGVPRGGTALLAGAVAVVSEAGQVELFGEPGEDSAAVDESPGRMRIFTWRVR